MRGQLFPLHRLVPTYFGNVPTGLDSWPWLGTVVKINNRHQETRFYPSWIPFSTCVSRFHICFIRKQHKHHSEKIYFWKMIHSWHQTTKLFVVYEYFCFDFFNDSVKYILRRFQSSIKKSGTIHPTFWSSKKQKVNKIS